MQAGGTGKQRLGRAWRLTGASKRRVQFPLTDSLSGRGKHCGIATSRSVVFDFLVPPPFNNAPAMGRREAVLGLAALVSSTPMAAHASSREDGIKLLRKQADAAKKKPTLADTVYVKGKSTIWLGPPKGSGADKCKVDKACVTGAGLKWDPVALGVAGGAYDEGKGGFAKGENSKRTFFKTPTYANSKF